MFINSLYFSYTPWIPCGSSTVVCVIPSKSSPISLDRNFFSLFITNFFEGFKLFCVIRCVIFLESLGPVGVVGVRGLVEW